MPLALAMLDEEGTIDLTKLDGYQIAALKKTHAQELEELKCRQDAVMEAFMECHVQYMKKVEILAIARYSETFAQAAYCDSLSAYGHSSPKSNAKLGEYLCARALVRKAASEVDEWRSRLDQSAKS